MGHFGLLVEVASRDRDKVPHCGVSPSLFLLSDRWSRSNGIKFIFEE